MRSLASTRGFSLIEVMVASAVLAGAVLSAAQLFAAATASTADARAVGEGTVLAWQKLEQLRSLAFTSDDLGMPVTDASTDTAASPERPFGGTGLNPSPAGTLVRDTDGYVDYLDGHGTLLGGGAPLPAAARYRRRWAIETRDGPDLLVLRVRVLPAGREVEAANIVSLRARRVP
jgi:prepilin-type N-terminal cleavage/methylation domain-containing protein